MKNYNEIHLVIDENYTATIRDLNSLKSYLDNQNTISKYFGEITYVSDECTKQFRDAVKQIRDNHIKRFNNPVGESIQVDRNQGLRDAVIVSYSGDDELIEYVMPNGTTALNIVKPDGSYKSMSYANLQGSNKWMQNLNAKLLINNPQSGKKFQFTTGISSEIINLSIEKIINDL